MKWEFSCNFEPVHTAVQLSGVAVYKGSTNKHMYSVVLTFIDI